MYYLYNDKNEYCGYSDIKISDNCTNIPVKPFNKDESVLFNNKVWNYNFKYNDNIDIDIKNEYEYIEKFLNEINSNISPNCGTYIKEKSKDISILIPCYGKAKYIIDSVTSCINQTLKPYEIVILLMDEESKSLKLQLEKMSNFIRCIECEKENPSKSRTHLVNECKTEYFVFLDADDKLQDNYLEVVYNDKNSIVFTVNNRNSKYFPIFKYNGCIMLNVTFLMCKEAFYEIGFDEELCWGGEDTDLIFLLFKNQKWSIGYTNKTQFFYNNDDKNSLSKKNSFYESHVKLLNKHKKILSKYLKEYFKRSSDSLLIAEFLDSKKKITLEDIKNFYLNKNKFNIEKYQYLISLLKISQNKNTNRICFDNNFYFPEHVKNKLFYLYKTFDIVFLGDLNIHTMSSKRFYIIAKDIKKEFEEKTKNMSNYEILEYAFKNYSCFLCKDYSVNYTKPNISSPLKIQNVAITLNKECNLKCEYCSQQYRTWKHYSDDEIINRLKKMLSHIDKITEGNVSYTIMGGEPSIFSDYLIKNIIKCMSKYNKFCVVTNGIIKNPLWTNCSNIYYYSHITDWINKGHFESEANTRYNIVVTHKDIQHLHKFIASNTDKYIEIGIYIGENNSLKLTEEDFDVIRSIEKEFFSVNKSLLIYDNYVYDYGIEAYYKACSDYSNMWLADCTDMKIFPCCGRFVNSYDYLEFNGQKTDTDKCKGCTSFTFCDIDENYLVI